mgnify:CR=1 FL=1
MKVQELVIGQVLTNNELAECFQCSTQGGMRRSRRTNTLVLISDQTKIYHDRWHGNILHYTGMGLTGDQNFDYMQNRTLNASNHNGVGVHLFEVLRPREYTYLGMVRLAAEPYMDTQPDRSGNIRQVCMFPLTRI